MKVITALPGPNFFYNKLESVLSSFKVEKAMDFGAAYFFNRRFFQTQWYLGLDVSRRHLQRGLANHAGEKSFAIQSNLISPPILRNYADLVVCTYTLIFIPPDHRMKVIENLSGWVRPGGFLIVEMPLSTPMEAVVPYLTQKFEQLSFTYFRSPLSLYFERKILPRLTARNINIPGWLVKVLTFSFENLYPNRPKGNNNVMVVARNKKVEDEKDHNGELPVKIDHRFFRDLRCPSLDLISLSENTEAVESKIRDDLTTILSNATDHPLRVLVTTQSKEVQPPQKLLEWLQTQHCTCTSGVFSNEIGQQFDVVIAWNFSKIPRGYFHFELYQMTKKHIFMVYNEKRKGWLEYVF